MRQTIHFCVGKIALDNFILPIVESGQISPATIFVSGNISLAAYPSFVKKLPCLVHLKYTSYISILLFIPSVFYLLFLILKYRASTVFAHMTLSSPVVLLAAFLARTPNRIYFNHGFSFLGYNGISKSLLLAFEYLNMYLSTRIICVSPTQLSLLKQQIILPPRPITSTLPGSCAGLHRDYFLPSAEAISKCNSVFSVHQPLDVVYVGRPACRKGFPFILDIIIETQKALKTKGFTTRCLNFHLIGVNLFDLSDPDRYSSLLDSSLCKTTFHGTIFNVKDYLYQSSIFILPSIHEGFGYAYLEACSQANCIMGFDIPGPDSLLINNYNSFNLSPASPASSFARLLLELFVDRSKLSTMMMNSWHHSLNFERSIILQSIDMPCNL